MPIRSERWPEGTPSWVDLSVKDLEGAKAFYGGLFGWEFQDAGEEAGHYNMASKGGHQVAGIGPAMDPNWPCVWTTYFAADSADDVAARVQAAGGQVAVEPFDVLDVGRMLVGIDTVGAAFGVWEARLHIGAGLYNEPGALIWNELHTRDNAAAQEFYGKLFGYTFNDLSSEGITYATFDREPAGEGLGGIQLDTDIPEGVPNYWLTWFGSAGVDADTAKVGELGGTVLMPPMDSPFGRMSVVTGPEGEAFGLIQLPAAE